MKPHAKKTFVGPPFCCYTFCKNALTKNCTFFQICDANTSNCTSLQLFIHNFISLFPIYKHLFKMVWGRILSFVLGYVVHTLNKFNKMQHYADIYLLLKYSTCFGRPSCPSSGVHKNIVAASGTDHAI